MRHVFINLPVADLERSVAFFTALGFEKNPQFSDHTAACMVVDQNIFVMLLTHAKFGEFVTGPIADANAATGVLIALSSESREAVTALKQKALAAGGRAWQPDMDLGFMFGASFQDPDGHVWETMWMDPAAVAGGPPDMAETAAV